jgi:inner membrane protease subunit 2
MAQSLTSTAKVRMFLRGVAYWSFWLLPPGIWIQSNIVEITPISGPSMYPFFNERRNETILPDICLNIKYNAQENLQRGMVVTYRCDGFQSHQIHGYSLS